MRIARLGWILAGTSSGIALVAILVYLATGELSREWLGGLAASYAVLLAAAVAFAVMDASDGRAAGASASRGPPEEPLLVGRRVVLRTTTGEAVVLAYRWPNGSLETRPVALTPDGVLTHGDIGTYVDALPPVAAPIGWEERLDAVLARHVAPEPRRAAEARSA